MRLRVIFAGLLIGLVLAPQDASARWTRSESVEWWSSISDSVVIAKVTRARFGKPDGTWQPEHVVCQAIEILKGKATLPAVEIDVDLWMSNGRDVHVDKPFGLGDRVLVFIARRTQTGKLEAAHWVNLAHPYSASPRAAYDNNCNYLGTERAILKIVKSYIAAERPGETGRRGIIVMFPDGGDVYHDFVRTADASYKQQLIKELQIEGVPDFREEVIYNLASYPGPETVKLIRPFLNDPSTTEVSAVGPERKTVKVYLVRQAAYLALKILGEDVQPPQPYFEEVKPMLFEVGFDDLNYFPYMKLPAAPK